MDEKLKEVLQGLLDDHTRRVIDQCTGQVHRASDQGLLGSSSRCLSILVDRLESLKPVQGHKHLCDSEGCDQEPVQNEILCERHLAKRWRAEVQDLGKTHIPGHPMMILDKNGVALSGVLGLDEVLSDVTYHNMCFGDMRLEYVIMVKDNAEWVRLPWNQIREVHPGR